MNIELVGVDVDRQWLQEWLDGLGVSGWPIHLIIANSSQKRDIYMHEYDGEYPGDMAFRAYVDTEAKRGSTTMSLFWDKAENINSILWLLIHELTHYNIKFGKTYAPLSYYFALKRDKWLEPLGITPQEYVDSVHLRNRDDLHEAEPEEIFANEVATMIVGDRFDRAWWRSQWSKMTLVNSE